jgi:glutathione S-transferase
MKLDIGNRNYLSWSMRSGALLAQADIEHEAVVIRSDAFSAGSEFKRGVATISLAGRAPVLADGALVVWDTLEFEKMDFLALEEPYQLRRKWRT